MRYLLAFVLLATFIPVNGQEKGAQSKTGTHRSGQPEQETQQAPSTVDVINHRESYLARLFAPENLPNIALFLVGTAGVIIAICTLKALQHQAAIMRGQLTVPYRAYLGLIEPSKPITDRTCNMSHAKFPIENTGHVRAKITQIEVEVIVQNRSGGELFRRSKVEMVKSKEGEIPPEKTSSYAVTVLWPSNISDAEQTVISIAITYKTGFKGVKPAVFSFVRVFSSSIQDWSKGYWGVDIDLTKT